MKLSAGNGRVSRSRPPVVTDRSETVVLAPVFPGDNLAGPANHQTIPWQQPPPVRRSQAENPFVELLHQAAMMQIFIWMDP